MDGNRAINHATVRPTYWSREVTGQMSTSRYGKLLTVAFVYLVLVALSGMQRRCATAPSAVEGPRHASGEEAVDRIAARSASLDRAEASVSSTESTGSAHE